MNKRDTKTILFVTLALFLTSLFSISLVSAAFSSTSITVPQSVQQAWNNWNQGFLDPGFAKILIFLLVFMAAFLVLENILGDEKRVITISASLIVAFLATVTITQSQILALMVSYSALGLTITTLLPLLLLFGLTYQAGRSESSSTLVLIQWLAWVIFLAYTIFKAVSAWFDIQIYDPGVTVIVLGSVIAAFIMVVFNRKVLGLIMRKDIEASSLKASGKFKKAIKFVDMAANSTDTLGKGAPEK